MQNSQKKMKNIVHFAVSFKRHLFSAYVILKKKKQKTLPVSLIPPNSYFHCSVITFMFSL
jgi:hypothetical protein